MNKYAIFLMIAVSALITFGLRAIPFIMFRNNKTMPPKLIYLGKILPSAIMAVLIVYCLKDAIVDFQAKGIAELAAAVVVVTKYKWKHNTLLSILLGTACNMLLLRLDFHFILF